MRTVRVACVLAVCTVLLLASVGTVWAAWGTYPFTVDVSHTDGSVDWTFTVTMDGTSGYDAQEFGVVAPAGFTATGGTSQLDWSYGTDGQLSADFSWKRWDGKAYVQEGAGNSVWFTVTGPSTFTYTPTDWSYYLHVRAPADGSAGWRWDPPGTRAYSWFATQGGYDPPDDWETPNTVPEPGALALLAMGGLTMLPLMRRRRA